MNSLKRLNLSATLSVPTLDNLLLSRCCTFNQFNQILSTMLLTGFLNDGFASSRLLAFSTTSNFIPFDYSVKLFDSLDSPNGFTCNNLMKAYVQRRILDKALGVLKRLLDKGARPDHHTYPILVRGSAVAGKEFEGTELHSQVLRLGFGCDVYVVNTLINLYGVCGNMGDARKVFDGSPVLDLVSWNSILEGYVKKVDVEEARAVFEAMPERSVGASNSMIGLLGKMGFVEEACRVFSCMPEPDLISWSSLISCHVRHEMYEEALSAFQEMYRRGIVIDEVVVVSVLSACAHLRDVKVGQSVHGLVVKIGIEPFLSLMNTLIHMYSSCEEIVAAQKLFQSGYLSDQITWNSMITGYLKCGFVDRARGVFDSMPDKDVVSWSAMLSGYAQTDRFWEATLLFGDMQAGGIRPDETTLVSVVSACTRFVALDQGKWIHAYIKKNHVKVNAILGATLIDMYMKCGCVENALEVFNEMDEKGASSWNALIVGFAMNGFVEKSLETFVEMKKWVEPNGITFLGVLGACRHMGLVDEGRRYFNSMVNVHKIEPTVKHYGCLVDLLGRAGMLEEAEETIMNMPISPDAATWGALLAACRKFRNNEMGQRVGRKLIELQPNHDGFHVLLSNFLASNGNWDDVHKLRGTMAKQGVVKEPGLSSIEVSGVVHEFLAGDRTHSRIIDIEKMLDEIFRRLKMEGYAPDMNEVLYDIDDEEKESNIFRHSEKLAIAFGLIATQEATPIRVMKNLRICNDCHVAAKLISKVFDRDIVVRDRHRFHHFKKGSCSCMDYW
uniref:DYW domain-containing protein n=1 Tax=Kalanchoe fedtschenkoi TaxID=63787 RepID=A0A7N0ZYU8_KALFE